MKFILILFFISAFHTVNAQSFKLQYRHLIHPKEQIKMEVGKADVKSNSSLPLDSTQLNNLVASLLKEQIQGFDFTCDVLVKNDSSYVKLSNRKENNAIELRIADDEYIVYKGKRYQGRIAEKADKPVGIAIHATGKTKMIMGYSCDEYVNGDATCHIWFCKTLPSSINPGITSLSVYPGALLAYNRNNSTVEDSYTLLAIRKME